MKLSKLITSEQFEELKRGEPIVVALGQNGRIVDVECDIGDYTAYYKKGFLLIY